MYGRRKTTRPLSITSTELTSLMSELDRISTPRPVTFKFCAQCLDDISSLWQTIAYCKHCKEYICSDSCLKQHARYRLTRSHTYILDDELKQYLRDGEDTNEAESEITERDTDASKAGQRKYPALRTEYKIRSKHDKEICSIHATVVLQNGNLVLVDLKNSNIKLYEITSRTCTSVLKLEHEPRDICISNIDHGELYVIELGVNKIHRVRASSEELAVAGSISTDGECYGVTCWKSGIAAVMTSPFKTRHGKYELRLMDYQGRVRRKFCSEKVAGLEFNLPWYLCSNMSGQRVFISDYGNNSVTCLDVDNSSAVLFVYKDTDLVRPVAMTVDLNDDLFIVGQRSHNVHHISSTNEKKGVIFSVKSGKYGLEFPGGIAYDKNNDIFYLQFIGWSDDIQAFNITNVPVSEDI